MNARASRLLLEASSAAANHTSAPHRVVAAREVSQIELSDLVGSNDAEAHLLLSTRESVLALALFRDPAVIAEVAAAVQALVRAARLQVQHSGMTAPRRWWIEKASA